MKAEDKLGSSILCKHIPAHPDQKRWMGRERVKNALHRRSYRLLYVSFLNRDLSMRQKKKMSFFCRGEPEPG
uniref:Uncharacterized protein n=1 Tax=Thermosporothrix sp. COM3 TaxID=2490863 RepID=A0A455SHP1_9CHLR|nr:hypothetical protein KTC_27440 [Thermosporothrix sp. COM3]